MGRLVDRSMEIAQSAVRSIFGGEKPQAPKAAEPAKTVPVMPDEDQERRAARRRAAMRFGSAGSGRASTILTSGNQPLGG